MHILIASRARKGETSGVITYSRSQSSAIDLNDLVVLRLNISP